jgi:hypothetical protein
MIAIRTVKLAASHATVLETGDLIGMGMGRFGQASR